MIHTTDFIATFGVKTKWKHLMAEQKVYVPTVGEEVANAVSHGVMLCLTLAALPFAAVRAYVHDGTAADVPRIDPLPLDAPRVTPQGGVPHPRPHLHLRRHRRNLHPDRTVGHRGLAGYLHYGTAMGDGTLRHHLQVARPPFDSGDQPDDLPGDGMDDRLLHAASCVTPRCRCSC